MIKQLLLGVEAIGQGAIDGGLSGVYAYPGTPSTEITEYIQENEVAIARNLHREWSANEKTAMESALGMSYAGKRAMVCMKHVGLNVAADPFINAAMTGINGGLIVTVADDPSMHSSQNEQDSRFYGKFAMIPVLEPSNQQEAYEMTRTGFDLSEKLGTPVLMRITTRLAHSRAGVVPVEEATKENKLVFLMFHASWCGWCHRMDSLMNTPATKPLFSKYFVVTHLVTGENGPKKVLDNPGANELMIKYNGDKQGIPYWVFLTPKGKLLSDSRMPAKDKKTGKKISFSYQGN